MRVKLKLPRAELCILFTIEPKDMLNQTTYSQPRRLCAARRQLLSVLTHCNCRQTVRLPRGSESNAVGAFFGDLLVHALAFRLRVVRRGFVGAVRPRALAPLLRPDLCGEVLRARSGKNVATCANTKRPVCTVTRLIPNRNQHGSNPTTHTTRLSFYVSQSSSSHSSESGDNFGAFSICLRVSFAITIFNDRRAVVSYRELPLSTEEVQSTILPSTILYIRSHWRSVEIR